MKVGYGLFYFVGPFVNQKKKNDFSMLSLSVTVPGFGVGCPVAPEMLVLQLSTNYILFSWFIFLSIKFILKYIQFNAIKTY